MSDKRIGCPPMYDNPEDMQVKIDEYFDSCEGVPLLDENGEQVITKMGVPVWKKPPRPYTVTGLALALGFSGRQALLNYQHKDAFMDTVTRAKAKVERYAEERLYDREGVNGARFSLINNFKGWKEKAELNATIIPKIYDDISEDEEDD